MFATSKLTFLARISTAGRTADGEYLFGAEFLFHSEIMTQVLGTGLVNCDHPLWATS